MKNRLNFQNFLLETYVVAWLAWVAFAFIVMANRAAEARITLSPQVAEVRAQLGTIYAFSGISNEALTISALVLLGASLLYLTPIFREHRQHRRQKRKVRQMIDRMYP